MDHSILVGLIQAVAFLTPVGVLVWKMSGLNHKVIENTKDIEGIGKGLAELRNNVNSETRIVLTKIDSVDKAVIELMSTSQHISDVMHRIEKKVYGE